MGTLVSLGAHQHVPNSRQSPSLRVALMTKRTARRVFGEMVRILAQFLKVSKSQFAIYEGG